MIKRMSKEILADRKQMGIAVLLIWIAEYALFIFQLSAKLYEPCIMDAFVWISYSMQETVYLIAMIFMVILMKDCYKPDKVVREKNLTRFWIYQSLKIGMISLIFSVSAVLGAFVSGRLTSDRLCIWDSRESYCYRVAGYLMEDVKCSFLVFTFFLATFLGIWISGFIPLLTAWYQNSYLVGVILCILINLLGGTASFGYDTKRDIFYYNIYQGIDLSYQFFYPILIILLCVIAGCFKSKRDFLPKSQESSV